LDHRTGKRAKQYPVSDLDFLSVQTTLTILKAKRKRPFGEYTTSHDVMLHHVARYVCGQDATDFRRWHGKTYNHHIACGLHVLVRNLKRVDAYVAQFNSPQVFCELRPLVCSKDFRFHCKLLPAPDGSAALPPPPEISPADAPCAGAGSAAAFAFPGC
jgi:hypothetical protein